MVLLYMSLNILIFNYLIDPHGDIVGQLHKQ